MLLQPQRHTQTVCTLLLLLLLAACVALEQQGPVFVLEPAARVEFSNSSGARIDCSAHGSGVVKVEWLLADGSPALPVARLRLLHPNGTLELPPFPADRLRHDVHSALYRCRASNHLGTILSRDVHVRAVVRQQYEVQVYDEYVISGNTAVLRCQVPSFASEFVSVSSWLQDGSVSIYPNTDTGGKYAVLGDLYVYDAGPGDAYKSYACRTVHRLTGEVHASAYPGRIVVSEPKGPVQPRITVDKHSAKLVRVGDDVTLACVAQGYPVPSYRWYREDREQLLPVAVGQRLSLVAPGLLRISKVRLEDRGKYLCWVNNSAGEETVQVALTVTAPLSAHVQPQHQVVDVGKAAVFRCVAGGSPVTQVTWLRNGRPVAGDARFDLSRRDTLSVRPVLKDDHGMYQCFVSNEWEQAQATAQLLLGDASPELVYWFSEQTLQPGPAVSLKCVATGNPPPQFVWTLDGFPVPDNNRFLVGQYVTVHDDVISHVNISSLREEDGGEYTCTARNAVAQVSHSARINVYGLPFIRPMPRITAVAGTDLIVKCPVAGHPIESITWERDGVVLPMNRRQRVYPNGTLVIEHAQRPADAGTYTCQAQNRQKHLARRDVEVQVLVPPKILPIPAMTNLLREGMRAAIPCQIIEGDLPVTFRWERNGQPLPSPGLAAVARRLDEYSASLVIEHISSAHSGDYTCIAQNVAGTVTFTVPLTVNVPPRWVIEPSDASVASGHDVVLHCQADGYPVPNVTWRRADGNAPGEYKDFLFEPNAKLHKNGSLEFTHVGKESEAHYVCEAKNEIGTGVSKVVFLKVNAPPHFAQKSKQVQVVKGEQAHLQCSALGDTPMELVWRVGGQRVADARYTTREQLLDEGMVSELGISHAYRHDTGLFACHATNAFGHDEMTVQLIVQEVPEAPKNVRVGEQTSRSLTVSWTQPYAGNSPLTGYLVQYKPVAEAWGAAPAKVAVPPTLTTATVRDLAPAASYHLRVLAENRLGLGEPGEVIQVTTHEEVPSGAPQDVRAEAQSSTEVLVSWEAPARDQWNGNILGYYVGFRAATDSGLSSTGMASAPPFTFKTVEAGAGGRLVLSGLARFTAYQLVVQAYNSKGAGPPSLPVVARTLEDAPSMSPENVRCRKSTSQSIEVTWEPPPVEGRNGIIQGYKVTHQAVDEWFDGEGAETKVTSSLKTTLQSLAKFTNYTVSVLAFTAGGDGVRSDALLCRTEEDVPSAPGGIKAVVSAVNKVVVAWMAPPEPNGVLTGFTLYIVEEGGDGARKKLLNPAADSHELVRDDSTIKFWITASTAVGEGEPTKTVIVPPSNIVPARILSFGREMATAWKQELQLACKKVGVPSPQGWWRLRGRTLETGGRKQINKDGSLTIRDVQSSDEGNYTCKVENSLGSDEISYHVKVRVPPEPPVLAVVGAQADGLQLQWSSKKNGGSAVLGYVVNYKRDYGDWEELQIESNVETHLLKGLWCGTHYQLYVTAYNRIGTGLPSDIVSATTKGSTPIKPTGAQLLTSNATVATLWLDTWADGGCPILYFSVEWRDLRGGEWQLASANVQPSERVFSIADLRPSGRYLLRVTAFNNAGATQAEYNLTMAPHAVSGVPEEPAPTEHLDHVPFYANAAVIVSVALALIFLLALFVVSWLLVLRKRHVAQAAHMGESPSLAQLQNQQNRDQQYLAVRVAHQGLDTASYKTQDSADYIEDICPYATFQLSKNPYGESTYSGNVYSGPYHSVQGSFVYHDLKQPGAADTYKSRHEVAGEYSKVRRKGGRMREAESQESDNLGSTDSEVKKILTLHLPISEYDTLGSDSEVEQEMVSFRHRRVHRDSTSSSETSPSSGRKSYPSRKPKPKGQVAGKRQVRTSSGYSSHTDETTFSGLASKRASACERVQQPGRFSDSHHELSEAECDRGRKPRLSRTRDTTFQINV
ncbi:cell adhesion molecule Dscam1 isoform X3 [Cloeon dipterum]|uniref:cell adhesion molecule Dscam1 isoform X3 n=1 Tax=Cloeon dipterum TaxID=197152 RepID=UPI00321F6B2D